MSRLFTSGGQSIGASASLLPVNTDGWFYLGLIVFTQIQIKTKGWPWFFWQNQIAIIRKKERNVWYLPSGQECEEGWEYEALGTQTIFSPALNIKRETAELLRMQT